MIQVTNQSTEWNKRFKLTESAVLIEFIAPCAIGIGKAITFIHGIIIATAQVRLMIDDGLLIAKVLSCDGGITIDVVVPDTVTLNQMEDSIVGTMEVEQSGFVEIATLFAT